SKKEKRNLEKENKKNELDKEAEIKQDISLEDQGTTDSISTPPLDESPKVDTAYMTADTLYSRVIFVRDYKPLDLKLDRNGGQIEESTEVNYGDMDDSTSFDDSDSLSIGEPILEKTLETAEPKILKKSETVKPVTPAKKAPEK